MSFWDDISESLGEISIDDVTGLVTAVGKAKNQKEEVDKTRRAQAESFAQPEHGTTADGRPILAGGYQGGMPWYRDPLKVGAAGVIGVAVIFGIVKLAK